jgi:hypothetical protein
MFASGLLYVQQNVQYFPEHPVCLWNHLLLISLCMRLKLTELKFLLCHSVSEPEQLANKELKGVAEEDALRKLLSSGEEDEEDGEV